MFKIKTIVATIFALTTMSAQAVSLGDLTMTSLPGTPMQATLEINDIDFTQSPVLVRIAPPATYLREGVEWPNQASDLFITKSTVPQGVKLNIVGEGNLKGSFPLLIELNVDGVVTVKRYNVLEESGVYKAVAADSGHIEVAEKEENKKEVNEEQHREDQQEELKEKVVATKETKKISKKRVTYAPKVVKEYVAVHGFDAKSPFTIQQNMTLWSIVRLYAPSYPTATMDQLVSAFAKKNPSAFIDGDIRKVQVGAKLIPPTESEALVQNAKEAFIVHHGASVALPQMTENIIEAQAISLECARAVGLAQWEAKEAGKSSKKAAQKGAKVLESDVCKVVPTAVTKEEIEAIEVKNEKQQESVSPETAPTVSQEVVTSEIAENSPSEPQVEESQPQSQAQNEVDSFKETSAVEEKPQVEPPVAEVSTSGELEVTAPEVENAKEKSEYTQWFIGLAILLGGLVLILLSRKNKDAISNSAQESSNSKPLGKVTLQKEIPATSKASIEALKATVDECVKNGTTAGAMGVGAQVFSETQMKEDRENLIEEETEITPEDIANKLKTISLDLDEDDHQDDVLASTANYVEQEEKDDNPKDKARREALQAKFNLAQSFVSMGAIAEANELLDEVIKQGSIEQKQKALLLKKELQAKK